MKQVILLLLIFIAESKINPYELNYKYLESILLD